MILAGVPWLVLIVRVACAPQPTQSVSIHLFTWKQLFTHHTNTIVASTADAAIATLGIGAASMLTFLRAAVNMVAS